MFSKIVSNGVIMDKRHYLQGLPRLSSRAGNEVDLVVSCLGLPSSLAGTEALRVITALQTAYSDEDAVRSLTVPVLRELVSFFNVEVDAPVRKPGLLKALTPFFLSPDSVSKLTEADIRAASPHLVREWCAIVGLFDVDDATAADSLLQRIRQDASGAPTGGTTLAIPSIPTPGGTAVAVPNISSPPHRTGEVSGSGPPIPAPSHQSDPSPLLPAPAGAVPPVLLPSSLTGSGESLPSFPHGVTAIRGPYPSDPSLRSFTEPQIDTCSPVSFADACFLDTEELLYLSKFIAGGPLPHGTARANILDALLKAGIVREHYRHATFAGSRFAELSVTASSSHAARSSISSFARQPGNLIQGSSDGLHAMVQPHIEDTRVLALLTQGVPNRFNDLLGLQGKYSSDATCGNCQYFLHPDDRRVLGVQKSHLKFLLGLLFVMDFAYAKSPSGTHIQAFNGNAGEKFRYVHQVHTALSRLARVLDALVCESGGPLMFHIILDPTLRLLQSGDVCGLQRLPVDTVVDAVSESLMKMGHFARSAAVDKLSREELVLRLTSAAAIDVSYVIQRASILGLSQARDGNRDASRKRYRSPPSRDAPYSRSSGSSRNVASSDRDRSSGKPPSRHNLCLSAFRKYLMISEKGCDKVSCPFEHDFSKTAKHVMAEAAESFFKPEIRARAKAALQSLHGFPPSSSILTHSFLPPFTPPINSTASVVHIDSASTVATRCNGSIFVDGYLPTPSVIPPFLPAESPANSDFLSSGTGGVGGSTIVSEICDTSVPVIPPFHPDDSATSTDWPSMTTRSSGRNSSAIVAEVCNIAPSVLRLWPVKSVVACHPEQHVLRLQDLVAQCVLEFTPLNTTSEARTAASDFVFPPEVYSRDLNDLLRVGSLESLVESRQHQMRSSRFNVSRCREHLHDDPEFPVLLRIASEGVNIPVVPGFRHMTSPPPRRCLHSHLLNVYRLHAFQLWSEGHAILVPTSSLQGYPIHYNPAHWTSKPGKALGRFLCDCSNGAPYSVLNSDELKTVLAGQYGELSHPTITSLVDMILRLRCSTATSTCNELQLWKEDIAGAFSHFNYAPTSVHLLAIEIDDDLTMFHTTGMFGWTGSPYAFGPFSRALQRLVTRNIAGAVQVYVDDFMGVSTSETAKQDQQVTQDVITSVLGPLAINYTKSSPPARSAEFIGWLVDLDSNSIRPNDRGIRKLAAVFFGYDFSKGVKHPVEVYQKLASLSSRYSAALLGTRPFVHPFYALTTGAGRRSCSSDGRLAVLVWRTLILAMLLDSSMFRVPLEALSSRSPLGEWKLITDAGPEGVGVALYSPFSSELWGYASYRFLFDATAPDFQNTREFLGLIYGLLLCHLANLRHHSIAWHGDNKSSLSWVRKNRSTSRFAQSAFYLYTWLCLLMNVEVTSTIHVPGALMGDIDSLSRFKPHSLPPDLDRSVDINSQANHVFAVCNPTSTHHSDVQSHLSSFCDIAIVVSAIVSL